MHRNPAHFPLLVAAGLIAVACGGADDDAAGPATTDGASDRVVTTTTAPPTSTVTAAPPATTADVDVDTDDDVDTNEDRPAIIPPAPFVMSALDEPPHTMGWPLRAGPWQSAMFDPPLKFETTTDLVLISQSPEAIVLTESDADVDARLTILTPLAVGGDDNVPTAVPDDFETYLRGLDSIDIRAVREFERKDGAEMVMADFTAREPVGHTKFACSIGPDCLWVMKTAAGEDVHVIEGAPIRIVATAIDGVPLRVVVSASDRDTFDRLATEAHHIAASFATTTDQPPENSRMFLSALGTRTRSIPPGIYVARVGDQLIEFDVESELDGIALDHVGSHTILFDVGDIGYAYVVQPTGLVDPDAAQSVDGITSDDLVDPPRSAADYEAWLSQMVVVIDRSTSTIGGLPTTSWTTVVDDTVDHYTCGPPMRPTTGGRCVTTLVSELGFWSISGSDAGFEFYVDDTGVQIGGGPTDPDRIDEFEQATKPLLDSIRFIG